MKNFKTTSPQGDGNNIAFARHCVRLEHFKTTSPQGDGNMIRIQLESCMIPISKPHPRKGTETTFLKLVWIFILISKPHPRKGTETSLITSISYMVLYFKTTSPQGDGNEYFSFRTNIFPDYFKTTSPQGDGNNLPSRNLSLSVRKFQNHIPARGRKLDHMYLDNVTSRVNFKTTSPQGDGNMHGQSVIPCHIMQHFKTTSPQGDGNTPRGS